MKRFPLRISVGMCLVGASLFSACASAGLRQHSASREAQSQFRLAQLKFSEGKNQEAIAALKHSLDLDPKNAEAHNYLGVIYLLLSDYDGAEKELGAALKLNPYLTDARNSLGAVYMKTGRGDRARVAFEEALKDRTYPNPEKILYNLGSLQMEEKRLPEATESFRQAVSANPKYAKGYFGLALALSASGRADEARVNFEKVITLDPKSSEAGQAREHLARKPNSPKG